jgi:hypothetical protein
MKQLSSFTSNMHVLFGTGAFTLTMHLDLRMQLQYFMYILNSFSYVQLWFICHFTPFNINMLPPLSTGMHYDKTHNTQVLVHTHFRAFHGLYTHSYRPPSSIEAVVYILATRTFAFASLPVSPLLPIVFQFPSFFHSSPSPKLRTS